MTLNYTRFYIRDFEFRKYIHKTDFEAIITINNRILVPSCNLLQLFRDESDQFTRYIATNFKVFIRFEENRGRIKIINSTKDINRLEAAIQTIIERFEKDMNYLYRKNKLPPVHHRRSQPSSSVFPNLPPRPPSSAPPALGAPVIPPPALSAPVIPLPAPSAPVIPLPALSAPVIPPPALSAPVIPPPAPSAPAIQPSASVKQGPPLNGLIVIINQPTPEILSKLYINNIEYSLAPEFLFMQMLNPHQPPHFFPQYEDGEIH